MRKLIMAAAAAATMALSLGSAEAFPVLPAGGLDAAPAITLVSGGCGPFGHRGFYGNCRPNVRRFYHRPYGFYRPAYGYHRFHHYPRYHRFY